MKFSDVVEQARTLLQRAGKITYRTLKREFDLDEEALADLKDELLFSDPQVKEESERGLVWVGDREEGEMAKRGNGEKAQIPDLRAQLLGPEGEAEACFLKAIEIAQKQQAKSLELRASTSLARLWQQQGKRAEAHRMLSAVYNWFTEGFDTKDLQEAKALLAVLVAGEEKTGEVAD